jgi:hypothetical protein
VSRSWGPIAIWSGIVLTAAAGMLLYNSGGMYLGVGLLGLAGVAAMLRLAARASRDW